MADAVRLVSRDSVERSLIQIRKRTPPPDLPRLLGMVGSTDVRRGIREQRLPKGGAYAPVYRFGARGRRLRNTGRLLNSITFVVVSKSRVVVGTNLKQAATMHFGDPNRRPKKGKYLAIPLARQIAAGYTGSFRSMFPDAFVIRLSGSSFGRERLFLVRRLDKGQRGPAGTVFKLGAGDTRGKVAVGGARLQFLAMLVKSVRIPPTPFLGISKRGEGEMLRIAEVSIGKVIKEAGAK